MQPVPEIVSYLTPLTGLTKEKLDNGVTLEAALIDLRSALPKNAVLVGTNIRADVQWLGLKEGVDFASMIDLSGLFRVWNEQYKSWSQFAQDHVAKRLLGVDVAGHVPFPTPTSLLPLAVTAAYSSLH